MFGKPGTLKTLVFLRKTNTFHKKLCVFLKKTFASDKFIGFSLRIRPPLIGNGFSLSFFKRAFKYEKRRYFKRGSPASDESST